MELYDLESELLFGKYRNRIIADIVTENAKYIEWCLLNVNHFVISETTANEIKKIYSKFMTSEDSQKILLAKYKIWEDEQKQIEAKDTKDEDENQYSYNDDNGSSWDNEYYNDSLDTDQQSPEWWDSL